MCYEKNKLIYVCLFYCYRVCVRESEINNVGCQSVKTILGKFLTKFQVLLSSSVLMEELIQFCNINEPKLVIEMFIELRI